MAAQHIYIKQIHKNKKEMYMYYNNAMCMILDNQYYVKTNSDLGVCNKMQLALCSWSLYSNLLVVTLGNLALSINQSINQSINRLFPSDQCTLARSFKFS